MGNNCVPYPYAESLNWCYCMSDESKTPVTDHTDRDKRGSVSYLETANYEDFDTIVISKREKIRTPVSCSKKTGLVRFNQPSEFSLLGNTCLDNTLPAVHHVNHILS